MHDILLRYLALKKKKLIGMLWVEQDQCYLAPLICFHAYNVRENITWANLVRMIEEIEREELKGMRKDVEREVGGEDWQISKSS